jgi:BA14K-like protein
VPSGAFRLELRAFIGTRRAMQFLVYLTVLMVSVSTVMLEVHWLTSPPPQPKAAVQASSAAPPAPKAEGPNPTLSPVYPTKADASPTQGDGTQQAQTPAGNAPRVIPGATVQPVPAQQPVASATPPSQATATPPVQQAAVTPPVQKVAVETTGIASREEESKPAASRLNPPSEAAASSNRCDVQACAGAYKSFRAADCTYQPFEGARRVCEKPPAGRSATREVSNEPVQPRKLDREESRGYSQRSVDRRSRQLSDDDDDDRADINDADAGPSFLFFGRRGRSW